MRHELRCHSPWLRALALTVISALGIVAIVGSGGGSIGGIPPYTGPGAGSQPTPRVTVVVEPAYVTALVGTLVTFTAEVPNADSSITYQWARSFDGGKSFVDIAGATGRSYSLNGVTLGDDAAVFRVRVKASSSLYGSPIALVHLAVSAWQGVVFEDGDFPLENWIASTKTDEGAPSIAHSEERITSGGNPGAFRQMFVQLISQAGGVFHASQSVAYDPASAGQIYVIDYEEDCMIIQRGTTMVSTTSRLMIEQAGRRYVPSGLRLGERSGFDSCASTSWSLMQRSSLGSQDFTLFDGPACGAGESCPDFSATGQPIRFGYIRSSSGGPGASITHGIDNWKVTVWRR
jgi:hypothetical protein